MAEHCIIAASTWSLVSANYDGKKIKKNHILNTTLVHHVSLPISVLFRTFSLSQNLFSVLLTPAVIPFHLNCTI